MKRRMEEADDNVGQLVIEVERYLLELYSKLDRSVSQPGAFEGIFLAAPSVSDCQTM